MNRSVVIWVPFALSVVALGLLFYGLAFRGAQQASGQAGVIHSQMVGKPLPAFETVAAIPGTSAINSADFADGKPRLLNIFASWCTPCIAEAPMLMKLKQQGVDIVGVAFHDTPEKLQQFIAENGDPYSRVGLDNSGVVAIAFGSSGVPESFLINGRGIVVEQHIGVVNEADIPRIIAKLRSAK